MKQIVLVIVCLGIVFSLPSCAAKKQVQNLEYELELANKDLGKCGENLSLLKRKLNASEMRVEELMEELSATNKELDIRQEQIGDYKAQVEDMRQFRDKTVEQVGDLTVLSQKANDNIKETLDQLSKKEKYIRMLQNAKTKADSINLALAVNLKGVLQQGLDDQDITIEVDKTVVFVNLSDKMLFQSGSHLLTPRSREVLGKIAKIIESRPNLEVMVEGYTDNVPMNSSCVTDNWDLSVKRSTSVVRSLQSDHGVDPNRLIAAGRGEYNTLASNETFEGRQMNRRTRIIILPKLNEFYNLLDPNMVPK